MEQGSDEWKAWRRSGLGSSDAAVVMGISPWTTRYQLWEEKTGVAKPDTNQNTFITDRGTRLEPRARAMYEIENGMIDMPPLLVVHEKYPWLRSSLDGFNQSLNRVLELKAPGAETHAAAKAGKVPPYYYAQVQQQLLVTGAERADYVSLSLTDEGKPDERAEIATVKVYPDIPYCRELFAELQAFWTLVETRTPPSLVDKDFKNVRAKGFKGRCDAYLKVREQAERMLAELCADPDAAKYERWRSGNLRIANLTQPGRIAYGQIPQLHGVNLEPFRLPATGITYVNVVEASADEP